MGRRIAQRAAAEGRVFIDVDMAMPREFSAEVQKLDMAVKAADVLCQEMRLLTLALLSRASRTESVDDSGSGAAGQARGGSRGLGALVEQ